MLLPIVIDMAPAWSPRRVHSEIVQAKGIVKVPFTPAVKAVPPPSMINVTVEYCVTQAGAVPLDTNAVPEAPILILLNAVPVE